ncbi:MAG: DUF389 domain-containing protein, partial [Geodermatophilaceae bacterium]|nr:DUF389 domain-containing protein [Geodermatophilaceae bacterium]
TDAVLDVLRESSGLATLAVLRGASERPVGDVILADLARESVDRVIQALRRLDVDAYGAIAIMDVATSVSAAAEKAEREAPGEGDDAVIWEQVVRTADNQSRISWTFLGFLTIASLIASIAIVVDSAVLLIGGMVLGPEFGPIAAMCVAAVHGRRHIARRAAASFLVGFAVAISVTTLFAVVARWLNWIDNSQLDAQRPATGFITEPDKWSLIVAFIAGIAGVLALTSSKSGGLVGVFISVTTVPAAGNLALAIALGNGAEIGRSLTQLGLNVVGLLLAGTLTLLVQKLVWRHVPRVRPKRHDRTSSS